MAISRESTEKTSVTKLFKIEHHFVQVPLEYHPVSATSPYVTRGNYNSMRFATTPTKSGRLQVQLPVELWHQLLDAVAVVTVPTVSQGGIGWNQDVKTVPDCKYDIVEWYPDSDSSTGRNPANNRHGHNIVTTSLKVVTTSFTSCKNYVHDYPLLRTFEEYTLQIYACLYNNLYAIHIYSLKLKLPLQICRYANISLDDVKLSIYIFNIIASARGVDLSV